VTLWWCASPWRRKSSARPGRAWPAPGRAMSQ